MARANPETLLDGAAAAQLAALGREIHRRGWALATSGNFSVVVTREPLRLLITASGLDKGELEARDAVEVDGSGKLVAGRGRPSDETRLHLAVVRARAAGAVLHTHSTWSTLLSAAHAADGGLALEGFEMLKALDGVRTHEHREWLPILDNSQDMEGLARAVEETLTRHADCHGFLLHRHGLYTWGRDLAEARRHLEAFEFLLEVVGRERYGSGV